MARNMARTKKEKTAATYSTARPQSGGSAPTKDKYRKAKPAGWRKSAAGKWYYENRRNRSDDLDEVERNKVYNAFKETERKAEAARKAAAKAARAVKPTTKSKASTKRIAAKNSKASSPKKARKRKTKQGTLF